MRDLNLERPDQAEGKPVDAHRVNDGSISPGRPGGWLTRGAACVLILMGTSTGAEPEDTRATGSGETFALPVWAGTTSYDLSRQEEGILVLDFFAFWCGPCLPASRDLEVSINQFYEDRGGNIQGVPVELVSINVEGDHPDKTDAFIQRAGLRLVLDDSEGNVFAQFGGTALPTIVILKSIRSPSGLQWVIAHQYSGYPGSDEIRSVIDSIVRSGSDPNEENPNGGAENLESLVAVESAPQSGSLAVSDGSHPATARTILQSDEIGSPSSTDGFGETEDLSDPETEVFAPLRTPKGIDYTAGFESLHSPDIAHFSVDLLRRQSLKSGYWDLWASFGRIQVDYEPVPEADVIGEANELGEPNASLQVSKRHFRTPFLEYQASAGGYYGFTDHGSLWLNEYYRQQFYGLEGYVEAEPWGLNISTGLKWDTRSAVGLLGAMLIFQQDDVAPGYDRPLFQPLERGTDRLYTGSVLLEQESIISRVGRIRNQVQLTQTTDRELRTRYNGNLNLAPAESWVIRLEGAITYEAVAAEDESDFMSWSGGVTVEYDWNQRWFLGFTGRRYEDNGQIETSILISSGPPALETTHLGVSLRHVSENTSWRLSLASYQTRYDEIDSPIRPFGNLYRDRDWLSIAASFNHLF